MKINSKDKRKYVEKKEKKNIRIKTEQNLLLFLEDLENNYLNCSPRKENITAATVFKSTFTYHNSFTNIY